MSSLERVSAFVKSYIKDDEGKLGEIYMKAIEDKVPVMRPETRELLKTQLLLKKPENILEIGTAVGYSSLYMTGYISDTARITTLELDSERVKLARSNITEMSKSDVIEVIEGDAYEIIKTLEADKYDFVFMDAAKGQYINYLKELYRVVKDGALIFTDNVLQDGEILESHYTVNKRNRTIHDRMREFLRVITTDERLESAILSVADGVALSVVKKYERKLR